MQTELRPVEGYLENVLDLLQHSDIIRSCLIELDISEKKVQKLVHWQGLKMLSPQQLKCY